MHLSKWLSKRNRKHKHKGGKMGGSTVYDWHDNERSEKYKTDSSGKPNGSNGGGLVYNMRTVSNVGTMVQVNGSTEKKPHYRTCQSDIIGTCPIAKIPTIDLPRKMWEQWIGLCKHFDTEWMAFLSGTINDAGESKIADFYFPPQAVGAAHGDPTPWTPEAVEAHRVALSAKTTDLATLTSIGGWAVAANGSKEFMPLPGTIGKVHSHVDMLAIFSNTDDDHLNLPIEIVLNRTGNYSARVRFKLECSKYSRAATKVYLVGDDPELSPLIAACTAAIKEGEKAWPTVVAGHQYGVQKWTGKGWTCATTGRSEAICNCNACCTKRVSEYKRSTQIGDTINASKSADTTTPPAEGFIWDQARHLWYKPKAVMTPLDGLVPDDAVPDATGDSATIIEETCQLALPSIEQMQKDGVLKNGEDTVMDLDELVEDDKFEDITVEDLEAVAVGMEELRFIHDIAARVTESSGDLKDVEYEEMEAVVCVDEFGRLQEIAGRVTDFTDVPFMGSAEATYEGVMRGGQ